MRSFLFAFLLACALAHAAPERFTLDNGARIILLPVPDTNRVAVIAAYDTGFLDDPAGLPQAAHLAEHLRCTSATPSWDAGKSFARLNELGSANAETLASMTYYDYALPPEHLALALRVESERLGALRATPEDIRREGPRAAAELAGVDAHPQRPVGKFALMALAQGWTHQAEHVNLRTALGHAPIGALRPALDRHTPDSLTLIITGQFNPADARRLIEETLGALPHAPAPPSPPIDWAAQPPRRDMTWDASTRVVAIACPVPEDPAERALLTALGAVARMNSADIEGVRSLFTSGRVTPVGPTPFFVLAALDDDADPDRVIDALHDRLDTLMSSAALYRSQLVMTLGASPEMSNAQRQAQARSIARMRSMTEEQAMGLVLANTALQTALREHTHADAMAKAIRAMGADRMRQGARDTLDRANRRVTTLSPRTPAPRP